MIDWYLVYMGDLASDQDEPTERDADGRSQDPGRRTGGNGGGERTRQNTQQGRLEC